MGLLAHICMHARILQVYHSHAATFQECLITSMQASDTVRARLTMGRDVKDSHRGYNGYNGEQSDGTQAGQDVSPTSRKFGPRGGMQLHEELTA